MGARGRVMVAGVLVAVLGAGACWLTLDALDLVPGVLTLEPPPPVAQPFPTAPGAVGGPAADAVVRRPRPRGADAGRATVARWASALAGDSRMGASTSVMVADVLTGDVLADVDGDVPQTPASTAKLLTGMAALSALGADRTLPTTVVQAGPRKLVLVGGGDMMLAAGAGDTAAVVGHAGLGDLADQVAVALRQAGTTSVSVVVDDTLFSGPRVNPDWSSSDVAHGYVASISPIAVEIAKTKPDEEYPPRYPDPALQALSVFDDRLDRGRHHGHRTAWPAARRRRTPGDRPGRVGPGRADRALRAARVGEHHRRGARSAGRRRARPARQLPGCRHRGARRGGLRRARGPGARLDDCCGLSAKSRHPRAACWSTRCDWRPVRPVRALRPVLDDLPVGGWLGTLSDRFTAGAGQGLVRAKTGSLPGVTSLAGTVQTQDGRLLAFAVLADQTPPGGQLRPRAAIDGFVQRLAGCGCSAAAG